MLSKKIFLSFFIFSFLMIVTSIVKNKTRLIEKKIISYEKKIANLNINLSETQLDYYYLTSPNYISEKIYENSNQIYLPMDYSRIYLSLESFLKEQKKTTKYHLDEEKIQKK